MIAKKNWGVDLERKRIVFFGTGLLVAGSFTLAAFTYVSPSERHLDRLAVEATTIVEIVPENVKKPDLPKQAPQVPRQQPNPDPNPNPNPGNPNAISPNIIVSSNGKTNPNASVGGDLPGIDTPGFTGHIDVGQVEEFPKLEAQYIGGYTEMIKFVYDNLEYPSDAIEMGAQGRVYVSFIVEKDGSVSNVKILDEAKVYPSIDREAARIVRKFPKWKPGENAYGPVRTMVKLPINFVLKN